MTITLHYLIVHSCKTGALVNNFIKMRLFFSRFYEVKFFLLQMSLFFMFFNLL